MNPVSAPEPSSRDAARRRFLKGGVALGAALAAGAARSVAGQPAADDPSKVLGGPVRPYGERSRFEQTVREKWPPSKTDEFGSVLTPLDETLGIITPSALHYVVQRGGLPDIDPRKHRLLIHGMVDRPVILQDALDHPDTADAIRRSTVDEDGLICGIGHRGEEPIDDRRVGCRRVEWQMDVFQTCGIGCGA